MGYLPPDDEERIKLLEAIFDALPDPIFVKNADHQWIYGNAAWRRAAGVPDYVGKDDTCLYPAEQVEVFFAADRKVFAGEAFFQEEQIGEDLFALTKKAPLELPDGSTGLVGINFDIGDYKAKQTELRLDAETARRADLAKSEFLANMSHEIRTPMNGVMGMAELLKNTTLDPQQATYADVIMKSGEALLTIINDILDFSKINAGQLTLANKPFNLVEAIEDVSTLLASTIDQKKLEISVRIEPDLPTSYIGDAGRVRQILLNLMGNAVKFTDSGFVYVDVAVKQGASPSLAEPIELLIKVQDSGVGIPQDKLKAVFDKFSQVDNSAARAHEGTGLGLAIASALVGLMGGEIGVDSVVGEGSTFWFTLRLKPAGAAKSIRRAPAKFAGARVLIVDDNDINRAILEEQTTNWGFERASVDGGMAALGALRESAANGEPFDLVILDYHMPQLTGEDVVQLMKADRALQSIPVLMLTSVSERRDGSGFDTLGVEAHLTKPVRSSLLLETILAVLSGAGSEESPPATADPPPAPPPTCAAAQFECKQGEVDILVADDNVVNQTVFRQVLQTSGRTFRIVENGEQAIAAFEESHPRLILMDVSMPVIDGLEATRRIRAIEAPGSRCPIIGVTAHAMTGDRERCLDADMDDYLPKPISPAKLIEKIESWLSEGARRRA